MFFRKVFSSSLISYYHLHSYAKKLAKLPQLCMAFYRICAVGNSSTLTTMGNCGSPKNSIARQTILKFLLPFAIFFARHNQIRQLPRLHNLTSRTTICLCIPFLKDQALVTILERTKMNMLCWRRWLMM